jgi:hypothetical protein
MSKELYFLRSSEQKIVVDMFSLAHPNLVTDASALEKYTAFYGLSSKDLGVYVLVDGTITGAIWARKFQEDTFATLSLGVLQKSNYVEIASFMMEQFLLEAAMQYEGLRVNVNQKPKLEALCLSLGFIKSKQEEMMEYKLEKKEIVRPSDGYDPRKWMD